MTFNSLPTNFIILFSLLFIISACSGTKTITTSKVESEKTIDGNLSGWNLSESLIESSEAVNYYAAYSDDYLYLYVDLKSLGFERAMRNSGFIIYLSSDRDRRKNRGIGFPSGTFNLLREYPDQYRSFLNDPEWGQNRANRELMNDLSNENFSRVLVVERREGSSSAQYGFVSHTQLESDGISMVVNNDRRLFGIELRVPLDGDSIYEIRKGEVWLGFSIEPPDFRMRNSFDSSNPSGRENMQRGNRNTNTRHGMQQRLGQYEKWFKLKVE